MPTLIRTWGAPDADRLWAARHDVVEEEAAGHGHFTLQKGPFTHYERTVEADETGAVTERVDYRLAPLVLPPFSWLYRGALKRRPRHGDRPFWAPPDTPDARAATALGALCVLAVKIFVVRSGKGGQFLPYLGTLLFLLLAITWFTVAPDFLAGED